MTTVNISVTSAWTKLADSSNSELLVTWDASVHMEVATTATNTTPTVTGHKLQPSDTLTRNVIGSGYVWMKTIEGTKQVSVKVVVTK